MLPKPFGKNSETSGQLYFFIFVSFTHFASARRFKVRFIIEMCIDHVDGLVLPDDDDEREEHIEFLGEYSIMVSEQGIAYETGHMTLGMRNALEYVLLLGRTFLFLCVTR